MSFWNIILCGDLPNTIVVSVTDPARWTVDNLKQLVIKDVPKATKSDITFSFCKNKLPEGVPLKECDGVRNGTGLLTSIKPFIIKVYSPDVDGTITVEIPLLEFDDWKIRTLLEAIHYKLAIDSGERNVDLLVLNGQSLSDRPMAKVSMIPGIFSGCLMTYTKFSQCQFQVPSDVSLKKIGSNNVRTSLVPMGVEVGFVKSFCFYNRHNSWLPPWQIDVQQLDGSKTTLTLHNPYKMSVIDLRKVVQQELSIPPHQQKLLLRDDVVLEDWKTTSNGGYDKTLITDYPSFCDGAKLYIVQLTGGIRVEVHGNPQFGSYNIIYRKINIHDRSLWTLQRLTLVMKSILRYAPSSDVVVYLYSKSRTTDVPQATRKSFSPSDELVSSVDWITDNCTLTFNKQ